ncbi:MAG: transporter substrate-binding domain-containing protein [Azospirillaceae bacterium]|nr:transporter substrate-binding domain-containing protein [Azospirillaceae bacterium]
MRRILFSFAFVISSILGLAPAGAEQAVAVDAGNPPFMYLASNGPAGIYPALIREIFKRVGDTVTIQAVPWKRAISELDAGTTGVGGIYKNSERLTKYDYSDKLFDEVVNIYVARGKGFAYSDSASLSGKTIGTIRGWSYGDDFDAAAKAGKFQVEEVAGDQQNFEKLVSGRLNAVLAIRESADTAIASGDQTTRVEALPTPLSVNPSFIAFNKSAAKTGLIAQINQALAAMRADGTYTKIVSASLANAGN